MGRPLTLIWPWQDRQRRFSALKAAAFALTLAPAAWLVYQTASGELGIYPMWLGGLTFWSGVWATAVLFGALAVTPTLTILNWRSLIDVRRMIGVAALAYTVGHIVIYFALRFWNFTTILKEMATPFMITATLSTIGLLALGLTSVDAAIARMGVRGWQRLHNTVYVVTALASALFAVLLEACLVWLKRGYPLTETLGNNFSLIFGIPPGWEILALGLLIALAAALVGARRRATRPVLAAAASGTSVVTAR